MSRFVRTVRPAARTEASLRLDTLPGEQAQVDWDNFGPIRVGATTRLLSCFTLVLSWSRACHARFALDQTLESFPRGHVEAFAARQGVPRTILYDNLKSVVLERGDDHIRFHRRVLDLAGHYHFAPQPCAVASGNEKGRVERFLSFLRHSFFAARPFRSLEGLNDPEEVRVRRRGRRRGRRRTEWVPLRKSVAYLFRYREVAQQSNARYLNALAQVDDPTPALRGLDTITTRKQPAGGAPSRPSIPWPGPTTSCSWPSGARSTPCTASRTATSAPS